MAKHSIQGKKKILNDPVYGFITIPNDLVFDIIEHPYFQRLRRITQLGLTSLVYNAARHNRFQHALGAMHLMTKAVEVIRQHGHEITEKEAEGVLIAILLHDIGHGPFSHTLEHSIVSGVSHEELSLEIMEELNNLYNGKLSVAISIFKNEYPKKFLHQLVSSQLDMDRLDYLKRDSFFTGVSEGVVGSDRIISMLNVVDDQLVVAAKGIYSIEKFIVARRLMYWQVYLHKTVISGDQMLTLLLKRAKELTEQGADVPATPALLPFLSGEANKLKGTQAFIKAFTALDDYDIVASIKMWQHHKDFTLSRMASGILDRKLLKIRMQKTAFSNKEITTAREALMKNSKISPTEASYFVSSNSISNNAYLANDEKIKILYKDGSLKDIAQAADLLNISVLSETVVKYFMCFPKGLNIS